MNGTPSTPISNLEDLLARMELRALRVGHPEERARIFNLAGDLCFDAGARERSLSYYGRAIDIYIATQQLEAAANMCRKIVRLTPEVVRARCTLAWVALGRGLIQEARLRIAEYAEAAAAAGKAGAAAQHLRLMTEVAENQEVLESLAEALLQVGDDAGANKAYGAALGRVQPRKVRLPDSPEERWTAILEMLGGYDRAIDADPTKPAASREQAVAAAFAAALQEPAAPPNSRTAAQANLRRQSSAATVESGATPRYRPRRTV